MAGQPRTKLAAVEALQERARQFMKEVRVLTPEAYLGPPSATEDDVAKCWRELRRCVTDLYEASIFLQERLEAKIMATDVAGPGAGWRNRNSPQVNGEGGGSPAHEATNATEQGGDYGAAQLDEARDERGANEVAQELTGPIQPVQLVKPNPAPRSN